MGVRLTGTVKNREGVNITVNFLDNEYNSAAKDISDYISSVNIQYESIDQARHSPIIPSNCNVELVNTIRDSSASTIKAYISELASTQNEEFIGDPPPISGWTDAVRHYIEIKKGGVREWIGWILNDQIIQPQDEAVKVLISATDGLGQLGDRSYASNDAGNIDPDIDKLSILGALTGYSTLKDTIIIDILRKARMYPFMYEDNEQFLSIAVATKEQNTFSTANPNLDTFDVTRVRREAFQTSEGLAGRALTCREVLEDILTAFQCRMFYANGRYQIVQIYNYTLANYIHQVYDHEGTRITSNVTVTPDIDIGSGVSESPKSNDCIYRTLRPVNGYFTEFETPKAGNILPPADDYETEVTISDDGLSNSEDRLRIKLVIANNYSRNYLSSNGNDTFVSQFKLNLQANDKYLSNFGYASRPGTVSWSSGSGILTFAGVTPSTYISVGSIVKIEDDDGVLHQGKITQMTPDILIDITFPTTVTSTPWFTQRTDVKDPSNRGDTEWSNYSENYYVVETPSLHTNYPNEVAPFINDQVSISIETPEIGVDAASLGDDATFELDHWQLVYSSSRNIITTNGAPAGPLFVDYRDYYSYDIDQAEVIYLEEGNEPNLTQRFRVFNAPVGYNLTEGAKIDIGKHLIGDNSNKNVLGGLEIYNTEGNWVRSSTWVKSWTADEGRLLHDKTLELLMLGQSKVIKLFEGTIIDVDLTALNTIRYDDIVYAFGGGTFNLLDGNVSGQWFQALDAGAVSVIDPIDVKSDRPDFLDLLGGVFGSMKTISEKISNWLNIQAITKTTSELSSGNQDSVSITAIGVDEFLLDGDLVQIINPVTMEAIEVTLNANISASAETMGFDELQILKNIPIGAVIIKSVVQ